MKHNILITTLVILTLTVIGLIAYIALKPDRVLAPMVTEQKMVPQKTQSTLSEEKTSEQSMQKEVQKASSELVNIDAEWNKYTNNVLGFTMSVPKKNYIDFSYSDCPIDNDVVVISDDVSGRVYIGSPNASCDAQYSDDDVCFAFSFAAFDQKCNGNHHSIDGGLIMNVVSIKNTSDALNTFIASRPGYDNCVSNGKVLPNGKFNMQNYLDGAVSGVIDAAGENACFLNWSIFAYYMEEKEKLAICDLGQAYRFLGKNDDESVQDRMFNSLKFE